jgi:hypothetical protein
MASRNSMTSIERTMNAIKAYYHINNRPPSIREVANLSGLSKSWSHECVVRLWFAKRIRYKPSENRSIEIITNDN